MSVRFYSLLESISVSTATARSILSAADLPSSGRAPSATIIFRMRAIRSAQRRELAAAARIEDMCHRAAPLESISWEPEDGDEQ